MNCAVSSNSVFVQLKRKGPFWGDLYGALVVSVFSVILCLSFGTLIFNGEIASGSGYGVGMALTSACLIGLIVSMASSYAGTIASAQDRIAPILAVMATQLVTVMPKNIPVEAKILTLLASVAATSLLTGSVLFLLGHYRMGNLIRFIPYPVIGGFLAGSGWLLVCGSFKVMLGRPVNYSTLSVLFEDGMVGKWLPGVLFGATLFVATRRFTKAVMLPAILVGSLVSFYIVVVSTHLSISELRLDGWLPQAPPATGMISPLWSISALKQIHWSVVASFAGVAFTVLITSLIAILLNTSGLELVVNDEVDINRELRVAGMANLAAGVMGGMVGFQSLSMSRLSHELGGRSRRVGIMAASLCGIALWVGPSPLSYLPKFVLGGLLLFLGLGFLKEWVYEAWFRLPREDYAVVIMILAFVGAMGYLEGVVFGAMAAIFLFIHNYSRVAVVTHTLSGVEQRSTVQRPLIEERLLGRRGTEILVLRLNGFLFFGTASGILADLRGRLRSSNGPRLRFVLLDFRRVSGIDSSAILSLTRARQFAAKLGFTLIFVDLPENVARQLARSKFAEEGKDFRKFVDMDHGLEWCENQILAEDHETAFFEPVELRLQLAKVWPNPACIQRLHQRLERMELAVGDHLIRQGQTADCLYFIESGEVSTWLQLGNGQTQRLRRQGAGTVVGELGLFLNMPRTADVVAERACVAYRLSSEQLAAMQRADPELAAEFHGFMVRFLAETVVNCNKSIRALAT